ncbi:MAG: hypothetical protein ACLFTK_07565 [Anaerolineales bacterium]
MHTLPRWLRYLSLVLGYYGLSGLVLNRLILNIDRYVGIGEGFLSDYYHAHWNYWWMREALTQSDLRVYETNYILFPYNIDLSLHTLAEFWFPLWALVEPLTNHFVAMNVILWSGLAWTGVATYFFLRQQGAPPAAAWVGGAWMSLMPAFTWAAAMTLPQYVAGFWFVVPFALWHHIALTRSAPAALLLGVVFWGMLLTDRSSLLVVALGLAPYALWTLYATLPQHRLRLLALGAVPFVVLGALGWFIAPLPDVLAFDRSTVSPADLQSTRNFALPLRGFLGYDGNTDDGLGILLGALTLISLAVPAQDRVRWVWFGLGAWLMLLSLGPDIQIGNMRVVLPYRLVYEATDGVFRAVARFAALGALCWLVFIGRTWSPYVRRWAPKWRVWGAALLLLAVLANLRALQPFEAGPPIQPYAFHQTLRNDPDDYVLIDVPVSVGSGWISYGNFQEAQFYALDHHKRTTNGLVARLPGDVYGFFLFNPTIGWLGGFRPLDEDHVRAELGELIAVWGVGYINVYQDYLGPSQAEEIISFLNTLDYLCPVTVERDAVFFRTRAHPAFDACPPRWPANAAQQIDIGTPGDERYLGAGFHGAEVIGGPRARWMGTAPSAELFIDFPDQPPAMLEINVLGFAEPQSLTIWLDELELGTFVISPTAGYQTVQVPLPPDLPPQDGSRRLRLDYPPPQSPAARGLSPDARPLSLALDWVRFRD